MDSWSSDSRSELGDLEELLQLHRGTHVAFDLQLAGHVGTRRVLLAVHHLRERLLRRRDDRVGIPLAFTDSDLAIADVDLPLPGALDVEEVRVVHSRGLRLVDAALQALEELPWCCHAPETS